MALTGQCSRCRNLISDGEAFTGVDRTTLNANEPGEGDRCGLLSACYSGVFVPFLVGPDTAIVTAASAERTSFGCRADNDWTFFGDALVNNALRKPLELAAAVDEAKGAIAGWEASLALQPSQPQAVIGTGVVRWLPALEAEMQREAGAPVGTPAISGFAAR